MSVVLGTLLTSDKQKIAYRHYKRNHEDLVIIVHGFYNSKDSVLLKEMAKNLNGEYDVFMFDLRGHGKSSGVFTWSSRESRDLRAVLDHLKGKYRKVGILCFSLGASVTINTLSQRKDVQALVCVSAVSDVDKVDYKFWELDWEEDVVYTLFDRTGKKGKGVRPGPFWFRKKKPLESIKKIDIPILFIHGDRDWVIKPWHSKALYSRVRSKKKLVVLKGGPHAEYLMKDFSQELLNSIKGWFKATLKKEE